MTPDDRRSESREALDVSVNATAIDLNVATHDLAVAVYPMPQPRAWAGRRVLPVHLAGVPLTQHHAPAVTHSAIAIRDRRHDCILPQDGQHHSGTFAAEQAFGDPQ